MSGPAAIFLVDIENEMPPHDNSYVKGRIVSAKTIDLLKDNAVYVDAPVKE